MSESSLLWHPSDHWQRQWAKTSSDCFHREVVHGGGCVCFSIKNKVWHILLFCLIHLVFLCFLLAACTYITLSMQTGRMISEIWVVNICMNRCGLMFIHYSSQKFDLLPNIFFIWLQSHRNKERMQMRHWKKKKQRKTTDCVSYGEVARRSQTVKYLGLKKKTYRIGWKGTRQMLFIPAVGWRSEGAEIWVMEMESEMSTDWVRAELGPSGRREYQHWLRATQNFGTIAVLMANLLDILCVCVCTCCMGEDVGLA